MITLTLLTQGDCPSCIAGKRVLAELSAEFALQIDEVDVNSDTGRAIAREQRLAFTPGLVADGRLIAHGRLSTRALRRKFTTMVKTTQSTQPEGS
ncbi:thioredoxin family protein [Cryobacterium sp. MDB1-18-2]|uniref:Thioredoxin family protein n=1 Tax=Cryobacterium glucosi TaxID=1259175 RepID=A0ABY2IS02_9MICO|nr:MULTISPECIES: thioredoxin family protein [Cryobacterium]TFC23225.1 thioredoxin family protein [Cryobacterium sp. MDB1-18-2]TFC23604.1 thioredoxin family protein [Cryobacterium glucosi]TFC40467.1 thioredoxin family protein [Cryobacterium sp. MDB1-18-1]